MLATLVKSALKKTLWAGQTALCLYPRPCRVCGAPTKLTPAYGRIFHLCQSPSCGFAYCGDLPRWVANRGMGLEGSWGGVEQGGAREDFIARMLAELGVRKFLLVGAGATRVFRVLRSQGFDVEGCDISQRVVAHWQPEFGDAFFHMRELPSRAGRYDAAIACEVIEHWLDQRAEYGRILAALDSTGPRIFCGTTDMRPAGEPIEDGHIGYMANWTHQSYWTQGALQTLAAAHGQPHVEAFEMLAPGRLFSCPRKRVFFATADDVIGDLLRARFTLDPVLPLDIRYPRAEYA